MIHFRISDMALLRDLNDIKDCIKKARNGKSKLEKSILNLLNNELRLFGNVLDIECTFYENQYSEQQVSVRIVMDGSCEFIELFISGTFEFSFDDEGIQDGRFIYSGKKIENVYKRV